MNRKRKIVNKEVEAIINWSALSQLLSNTPDSIRQTRIPKKYEYNVNKLIFYISCWHESKELISPSEFEDKIKDLNLISIITGEK